MGDEVRYLLERKVRTYDQLGREMLADSIRESKLPDSLSQSRARASRDLAQRFFGKRDAYSNTISILSAHEGKE